jgi:hypothetical protein
VTLSGHARSLLAAGILACGAAAHGNPCVEQISRMQQQLQGTNLDLQVEGEIHQLLQAADRTEGSACLDYVARAMVLLENATTEGPERIPRAEPPAAPTEPAAGQATGAQEDPAARSGQQPAAPGPTGQQQTRQGHQEDAPTLIEPPVEARPQPEAQQPVQQAQPGQPAPDLEIHRARPDVDIEVEQQEPEVEVVIEEEPRH